MLSNAIHNTVIILIGYPWSGKYTIAKELKTIFTNTHIVDNHKTNDVFFPFLDLSKNLANHNVWKYIREVRACQNNFLIQELWKDENIIYTRFLFNIEKDINEYNRIVEVAKKRNSILIPIIIHCTKEEILNRISNEDRKQKLKITDPLLVENIINQWGELLEPISHEFISIDVTCLTAQEAAQELQWKILHYIVRDKK